MARIYLPGGVPGEIKGLKRFHSYLNRMFRKTFVPKKGDASNINHYSRNVLVKFDPPTTLFHVFNFVWEEIRLVSFNYRKGLVYAPHFMRSYYQAMQ
uniref:Uncharacterized protein n=1 Tax=Oryza punctata TaxID=4537 RepID=A0A0E0L2H2_ORYPU